MASARSNDPFIATDDERETLSKIVEFVCTHAQNRESGPFRIANPEGHAVELPDSLLRGLVILADQLSRGHVVSIGSMDRDLTMQQAAQLLNTPHTYLQKLLDQGEIPFTTQDGQRFIAFEDAINYKRRAAIERREALDELTAISDEMGLYDD